MLRVAVDNLRLRRCEPVPADRRGTCGIGVADPPDRPDLATYSQEERFAAGVAPSWDSPDILTNSYWPWTLLPEVRVRVRNVSPTASAVNLIVHLHRARFGLGGERIPEASRALTLAPGAESQLLFALGQATLAGDQSIGVYPVIEHPHDPRVIDNRGAQVVFGARTSEIGRTPTLHFPVRNPSAYPQTIDLSLLANDLGGVVTPPSRAFAPLEEVQASLQLTVPAGLPVGGGPREVTVVARGADGSLVDGLTYLIFVDA
jgi:hypothetical protein